MLLSLHNLITWLGALGALVYQTITSACKTFSRKVVIPRVTLHQQFVIGPVSPWPLIHNQRLSACIEKTRRNFCDNWIDTAPGQTTEEGKQSITLRELLHRNFAVYVSEPRVKRLLLHKDNQAVMAILNAMVSASRPMMVEIWKLEVLMRVLEVKIEAKWLPRAGNRFPDSMSGTWDPSDAKALDELLESIQDEFQFDHIVFANLPMGETYQVLQKYIAT